MSCHRIITVTVLTLATCALFGTACFNAPPSGGATTAVPDPCTGEDCQAGVPVLPTFSAFLSTDRPRIIRNDANEGSAEVTVTTSEPATFEWCVEAFDVATPENALPPICSDPAAIATAEALLEFNVPSSTNVGTESTLEIVGIISDPGPNGKQIRVSTAATLEGADAEEPFVESGVTKVSQLFLRIVRPRGPLAAAITSLGGSTVPPDSTVTLEARITGGRSFDVDENEACSGTNSGTDDIEPPNANPSYNVSWRVVGLANELLDVECLFNDDGETVSRATYRAPVDTGNVVIFVEITDASGNRVTASLPLVVSSEAPLAVASASASSTQVEPGGSVTLRASGQGGTPPYTIQYSIDPDTLDGTLTPVGGSPAGGSSAQSCPAVDRAELCSFEYHADGTRVGSDLVSVLITDAVGATATASIPLIVSPASVLAISAVPGANAIVPGSTTPIDATVVGGTTPYTVTAKELGGFQDGVLSPGELSGDGPAFEFSYQGPIDEGTAQIQLEVTDAVGATATAIVVITVTSELPLAITAVFDKATVPPKETAELTANVTGGTAPYTVQVTDLGTLTGGTLNPDTANGTGPSFTFDYNAPLAQGTAQFKVDVTDAVGDRASAVVLLSVASAQQLTATTILDATEIVPEGTATATVTVQGGTAPYTIDIDQLGPLAGGTFNPPSDNGNGPSFDFVYTAPLAEGSLQFKITVTDAVGSIATDLSALTVASANTLAVTAVLDTTTIDIAPDTANLAVNATGGTGPYDVDIVVSGLTGGTLDPSVPVLDDVDGAVDFTYTPPPLEQGTVQFRVEVTDAVGASSVAFALLSVGTSTPLGVVGNATSSLITPGSTTNLVVTVVGGNGPYNVELIRDGGNLVGGTLNDPGAGCVAVADGWSCAGDGPTFAFGFTAPSDAVGTAQFSVDVEDVVGSTASATIFVSVQSAAPLTMAATASPNLIVPEATSTITANVIGGTSPYTVTAVYDSGLTGGSLDQGADTTAPFSFVYTAPLAVGTVQYRIEVTDNVGATSTSFVSITVASAQPLEVTLSAARTALGLGEDTAITGNATGGTPPYDFTFSVDDTTEPKGTINPTTVLGNVSGSAPSVYTAPMLPTSNVVTVRVEDAVGQTASFKLPFVVGAEDLTINATVNPDQVTSSETVTLTATPAGGVAPYTIVWTRAPALGTFPAGNTVNWDGTGAVPTRSWTPPGVATPTVISFTATVTDDIGTEAQATGTVTVLPSLDASISVTPTQPYVNESVTLEATVTGGSGVYLFEWRITDPNTNDVFPTSQTQQTTFTPTLAGTYSIGLRVDDDNGVEFKEVTPISLEVFEQFGPGSVQIISPVDGSCFTYGAMLDLISQVTAGHGAPPLTYLWEVTGSGSPDPPSDPSAASTSWASPGNGPDGREYTISLTVNDNRTQSANPSVIVTANTTPDPPTVDPVADVELGALDSTSDHALTIDLDSNWANVYTTYRLEYDDEATHPGAATVDPSTDTAVASETPAGQVTITATQDLLDNVPVTLNFTLLINKCDGNTDSIPFTITVRDDL